MPTKSANNATELNFINYDSTNNRINFGLSISSNSSAIGGEDVWVRTQANEAFTKANTAISNTNLNVSGTLRMLNQGGDEGGEIFLDKALSNTTLSAGLTIDVYQNKLRIFENGGSIRGAFIDIANTTANGVGSEITKYDANNTSTGFLSIPKGTTAQRPASAANGHIRFNTTTGNPEWYNGATGAWLNFNQGATYQIEYLVVGGGGAGGGTTGQNVGGGGGGGGGYVVGAMSVTPGTSYAVVIGAGGAGSTTSAANGSSTTFNSTYTAYGGGRGAGTTSTPTAYAAASSSASGGGGYGWNSLVPIAGGAGNTPVVSPQQGYPGGSGYGPSPYGAGGGGGATGAGVNATAAGGGNGGPGYTWLNGIIYAGGGGGGYGPSGVGGTGQGGGGPGNGGSSVANGTPGVRGGGGGGGGSTGSGPSFGGNGGDGTVVIRYLGTQRGLGGTITSDGGYTYHTFTGSGTFTA